MVWPPAFAFAAALLLATQMPARSALPNGAGAIIASVRDIDGHPIAGARVVAAGPVSREATTSLAGIVTLLALPLGAYGVRVTRSGFEPYGTLVTIASDRSGPKVLNVRIVPATFANLRGAAGASTALELSSAEPLVSHALAQAAEVDIVPVSSVGGAAPVLLGTSPNETRIEVDGIPVAGGSGSLAALRFRNALALDDIELVRGPALASSSLRNAIGGIINYRTPEIGGSARAGAVVGYNSTFGAFQRARANERFGRVDALADIVTGGGENRSQVVKLRYAFAPGASIGYANYGSQSSATSGLLRVTSNAPAFAADLRAPLGSGTFEARAFGSSSFASGTFASASGIVPAPATAQALENARVRGLQLGYALPLGEDVVTLGFDRRSERTADALGRSFAQTFSSVVLRADIRLSPASRVEIGDSYAGGTQLPRRHDPEIAFALHPDARTTVRASFGSAYATAPQALLGGRGNAAGVRAPETSFGYRLRADEAVREGDHLWSSLYDVRRFDSFAPLSGARSTGVDLGYERTPLPGRLGALAYVQLQHSYAYGTPELPQRIAQAPAPLDSRLQLEGEPYSKARLALAYGAAAGELRFGTTLLGANNALAPHAIALADAALRLSFAHVIDVRFGIENLFGQRVGDARVAPFFAPHEYTLTIGSSDGS